MKTFFTVSKLPKFDIILLSTRLPLEIKTEEEFAHSSLIIVFKAAFKYLETASKFTQKDDFCTEILNDLLTMLKSIRKPLIYSGEEANSSKLLAGFLDHAAEHLFSVLSV